MRTTLLLATLFALACAHLDAGFELHHRALAAQKSSSTRTTSSKHTSSTSSSKKTTATSKKSSSSKNTRSVTSSSSRTSSSSSHKTSSPSTTSKRSSSRSSTSAKATSTVPSSPAGYVNAVQRFQVCPEVDGFDRMTALHLNATGCTDNDNYDCPDGDFPNPVACLYALAQAQGGGSGEDPADLRCDYHVNGTLILESDDGDPGTNCKNTTLPSTAGGPYCYTACPVIGPAGHKVAWQSVYLRNASTIADDGTRTHLRESHSEVKCNYEAPSNTYGYVECNYSALNGTFLGGGFSGDDGCPKYTLAKSSCVYGVTTTD